MADLSDIRRGLAANLEAILGIQVSPYILSNPTPPAAQVWPGLTEYDQAMARGIDQHMINVQVLVGAVSDIGSQQKLDEYMAGSGASSVKAALESDRTLGGTCQTLRVQRCSAPQVLPRDGGGPILSAVWEVEVLAEGA